MTTHRPPGLAVVTGTGTGVGKTWFAAVTLGLLRSRGVAVAARKPAQSFEEGAGPTDAEVLAAATGEAPEVVCPPEHAYPLPLAPPIAAVRLGRPAPTLAQLVAGVTWPMATRIGLVEGVGGPRSPLAVDADTVDLVAALDPDVVVVVAESGLGAINAVRLTVAPFADRPVVVALNRYDETRLELDVANRDWLRDRDGVDLVTSPTQLADRLAPFSGGRGTTTG